MIARATRAFTIAAALALPMQAQAQSVEDLQRQIDELKAQIKALVDARAASEPSAVAASPATPPAPPSVLAAQTAASPPAIPAESGESGKKWYDRLKLRGYTQMRYNGFLSGDRTAPASRARLRSVHDSAIDGDGGFALRRARLVLEGDVTDRISIYLQHDFASAVNSQSNGERREHFGQLRDAYVDLFPTRDRSFRLRFGQSKVPFGWENLQSSSNRLTLDRSDAINSAAPGERDLGIVAYYTPPRVQAIWDALEEKGQKLFGNYGAFGLGVFNGAGTNRSEHNGGLMTVAMATWPFALDGLGGAFDGQVLEIGGSVMRNRYRPEIREGGVSAGDYKDDRIGLHAILYPQPLGIQAEWNWGRGPEFDLGRQAIRTQKLSGGYVQLMVDAGETAVGKLTPYARWQHYRGGWKAATNAPRLETDEIELGVEWRFMEAMELTVAYARMKRAEADERRTGRATGDLIRTQLQWNY